MKNKQIDYSAGRPRFDVSFFTAEDAEDAEIEKVERKEVFLLSSQHKTSAISASSAVHFLPVRRAWLSIDPLQARRYNGPIQYSGEVA